MRIGIDGRPLEGHRSGVGRVLFELMQQLDILLPEAEFFVYGRNPMELPVQNSRWHIREETSRWAKKLSSGMWLKWRCGRLCLQDQLDIFFAPVSLLPKLSDTVKVISIVHDLNWILAPETMPWLLKLGFNVYFKKDLHRAHRIITPSQGTADRLFAHYGVKAFTVIYHGIFRSSVTESRRLELLEAYQLHSPFLLFVGSCEPRKNLELLIGAFLSLKSQNKLKDYQLVFAGDRGWKNQTVLKKIEQNHQDIRRLGFVSDEALACLYASAALFVFPSQYEGFGLPIAEALSCGARVLASDTPETREAGLDYAHYVTPSLEELSAGILHALSAPKFLTSVQLPFDWKISARAYVDVVRSLV